jgi:hypothetical protein
MEDLMLRDGVPPDPDADVGRHGVTLLNSPSHSKASRSTLGSSRHNLLLGSCLKKRKRKKLESAFDSL